MFPQEVVARHWNLEVGLRFPSARTNFVAPATRADGMRSVLKISEHRPEVAFEIAALRLWETTGVVPRILDWDEDLGAMLLEEIRPGQLLAELYPERDDESVRISAALLRKLWGVPPGPGLRSLEDWCAAFGRADWPDNLVAEPYLEARDLLPSLLQTTADPVPLHGDLHHENVLLGGGGWRVIDPKGLVGDRHFDICQFLVNPLGEQIPLETSVGRVSIFCDELGLDVERVSGWILVHAVLNVLWAVEDGLDVQEAFEWVERSEELRPRLRALR